DRYRGLARLRRDGRGRRRHDPAAAPGHRRRSCADDRLPGLPGGRLRDWHDGRGRRRRRQRRPAAGPRVVSRPLGSVERAVTLLEALGAAGGPLGTNELARQTQINASTVSRVLATLLAAGLVDREPGGQRWQLGLRLVHLGNAALARLDLRDLARPLLEQLVRETGETATLSLPAQGEGVTVDFAPSPHSVSSRAEIGRASVAHATAVGKLVLAHTPGALASLSEPL